MPSKLPSLSFRPRERRLALIAGVVIGCWVLVSWAVQPLWNRVGELREEVTTDTDRLDRVAHLLKQAGKIEQRYQAVAAYVNTDNEEPSRGAFLNELESLSRSGSLRLNMKPRPVKQDGELSRFEIELDVEGSQEQLLGFVDSLLRLPALVRIERLRISTVPTKQILRANLVIQRIALAK